MMKSVQRTKNTGQYLLAILPAILFLGACQHSGNYNLPTEYIPEPAGTRTSVAFEMQSTKAEQVKYNLPASNWYGNTVTLSPKGQQQVEWIVSSIEENPYDVNIEPTGQASLDENRRAALVDYFELQGIADAEMIVSVASQPFNKLRVAETE